MRSKVKKAKGLSPLDMDDEEALTWKCASCGAENANFERNCNECGLNRPGASSSTKAMEKKEPEVEATLPEPREPPEPDELAEPEEIDTTEDVEATKDEDDEEEPELEASTPTPPPSSPPSPQITIPTPTPSPTPQISTPPLIPPSTPPPPPEFSTPPESTVSTPWYTPPSTGQGRYSFVFVNTPAQSLIKSKVPIDFDIFPVITIGRSPENVVVIPDQEVSRRHAELSMDGNKLIIKDLQSKNGTYVYDGKQFQQVSDSAEVKPNSIVKFGTGTIVRLISE